MKNIFKVAIATSILILAGCGTSSKPDVLGKSFTYKECSNETMTVGESSTFYSTKNSLSSEKETILEKIKTTLCDTGSSSGGAGTSLTFSDHVGLTGYKYNDKEVTCYSLNFTQLGEYQISDNGYYASVDGKTMLLEYNSSTSKLEEHTFELANTFNYITGSVYEESTVTMSIKEINYDSSNKQLSTVCDIALVYVLGETETKATCEYTISWSEK